LSKLNKILESKSATKYLISNGDLDTAYQLTNAINQDLETILNDIVQQLDNANAIVNNLTEVADSDYRKAIEIDDLTSKLFKNIRAKRV